MSYEQLLHDFVDGLLGYEEEARLFAELNASDRLRGELKAMMTIRDAVHHDVDAYMPPIASTAAIMDRLGFSLAPPVATGGLRVGQMLTGGALGAMMTALLFLFLSPRQVEIPSVAAKPKAAATSAAGPERGMAPVAPPLVTSGSGTERSATHGDAYASRAVKGGASRRGAKPIEEISNEVGADLPATADREIPSIRPLAVVSSIDTSTTRPLTPADRMFDRLVETARTSAPAQFDRLEPPTGSAIVSPAPNPEPSPLAIEIRAITSRDFVPAPAELAGSAGDALLLDRAIGVRYDLDERQAIGVEMGNETFSQNFEERTADGSLHRFRQSPALLWGGVTYRYVLYESAGPSPWARASLGFTRLGPTGRVMLGASWGVAPALRLFAGAELTGLAYRTSERWYLSPKYGITYGLSLNF